MLHSTALLPGLPNDTPVHTAFQCSIRLWLISAMCGLSGSSLPLAGGLYCQAASPHTSHNSRAHQPAAGLLALPAATVFASAAADSTIISSSYTAPRKPTLAVSKGSYELGHLQPEDRKIQACDQAQERDDQEDCWSPARSGSVPVNGRVHAPCPARVSLLVMKPSSPGAGLGTRSSNVRVPHAACEHPSKGAGLLTGHQTGTITTGP